ncbi:MAG: tyrosine-protein phosphatase [Terriglobales bacterium]
MFDIHSHILPEVDDGARSWEIAIQMCQMAAADGIQHMVATPHANDEFYYDRDFLQQQLQKLRERVGPRPSLSLGCDFHLSVDNLQELAAEPHRFTIETTPYLLIELSDHSVPPSVTAQIQELLDRGVRPILTHPERNPILMRRPELVLEWASLGCAVQVTASSLTNRWGEKAKEMALWLLAHEAVHILASDAHSTDGRPPILSAGRNVVTKEYGYDRARALVQENPRAVVLGQPLPYFPLVR